MQRVKATLAATSRLKPLLLPPSRPYRTARSIVRPDSRASKAHVIGQEAKNRIVSKLHSLLARFILRRTKDEVQLYLP